MALAPISVGAQSVSSPAAASCRMTKVFRPGSGDQAEAPRRAQLTRMDDKAYSHSFYWAAFSLVGDGARPFPVN